MKFRNLGSSISSSTRKRAFAKVAAGDNRRIRTTSQRTIRPSKPRESVEQLISGSDGRVVDRLMKNGLEQPLVKSGNLQTNSSLLSPIRGALLFPTLHTSLRSPRMGFGSLGKLIVKCHVKDFH